MGAILLERGRRVTGTDGPNIVALRRKTALLSFVASSFWQFSPKVLRRRCNVRASSEKLEKKTRD
jgi:hypothetical protein